MGGSETIPGFFLPPAPSPAPFTPRKTSVLPLLGNFGVSLGNFVCRNGVGARFPEPGMRNANPPLAASPIYRQLPAPASRDSRGTGIRDRAQSLRDPGIAPCTGILGERFGISHSMPQRKFGNHSLHGNFGRGIRDLSLNPSEEIRELRERRDRDLRSLPTLPQRKFRNHSLHGNFARGSP